MAGIVPFDIVVREIIEAQNSVPLPSLLGPEHFRNCRVVVNRFELLDRLPKNAVCAEVGVLIGQYSKPIWERTQPKEFHLIDKEPEFLDAALKELPKEQINRRIWGHVGDSWDVLRGFPDNHFDWIYLDADHSFKGISRDLEWARQKVKPNGLIAVDDYIMFDHVQMDHYGVVPAVNQFCREYGYEFLFYALHDQLFCNVVLRKMRSHRLAQFCQRLFRSSTS